MNRGTLLIRADASAAIGTGHVMRCLALAQAWRAAEGEVVFAMAESTAAIKERLSEERCQVVEIAGAPGSSADCASMQDVIEANTPSWIVMDGYAFASEYRQAIQETGKPCLIVDDSGSGEEFNAELIVNQNLHASEKMYERRGRHTRLLLGPRYAMLRNEFARYRHWSREIAERASRVLLTMGGSDPSNLTPRVLEALVKIQRELEIRVAIGGSSENAEAVGKTAAQFPERVKLFRDSRNMPELMTWADLAIAGAGTTCWEMCLLGLPAMLIVVAENQAPIAQALAAAGAAINVGVAGEVDGSTLAAEVESMLSSADRRRDMSRAARKLVDGWGRERVLEAMGVGDKVCA